MEWTEMFSGVVVGTVLSIITTLLTLPSVVRKARGEARSIDLDNMQKAVESWKQIADERQETMLKNENTIKELNEKIDNLYVVNSDWRDKYNSKQEEIASLKIQMATDKVRECIIKHCKDREPQSGY